MQLKFRAWDKRHKKMFCEFWFGTEEFCAFGINKTLRKYQEDPNWEVMQFSGLHDTTKWEELTEKERAQWTKTGNFPSGWKGREIYEGDIVCYGQPEHCKTLGAQSLFKGIVFYDADYGAYRVEIFMQLFPNDKSFFMAKSILPIMNNQHTIIGNIHQHPEILQSQQVEA